MTTNCWSEVDCPCRDDGPWSVWGPPAHGVEHMNALYLCARCGADMTITQEP